MIFLKWCHYAFPFSGRFTIPKLIKPRTNNVIHTKVKFDESIRYVFHDDQSDQMSNSAERSAGRISSDQADVNKLFGVAYRWHHLDSDRVGFRYVPDRDEVEIVLYSYVNGTRIPTKVCSSVPLNTEAEVVLSFRVEDGFREVYLWVDDKEVHYSCECKSWKWLWYSLTGYFGGNRRAPWRIKVECE